MQLGRVGFVKPGAIGLYLFALFLLYLAAAYLGGAFVALFLVCLLFPALSIASMVLTALFFKYHQDFSSDHPVKGEEVVYTLSVSKESPLPAVPITLRLIGTRQGLSLGLGDISMYPGGGRRFSFSYTVRCPFRGVYVVGLEATEVHDYIGWFSFFLAAWTRTFYVYPRVIDIHRTPFEEHGSVSPLPGLTRGSEEDSTLVESLRGYRPGQPTRHIFWKKFASLGEPVLKQYESSSQPGVTILLDTRGDLVKSDVTLEMEDASIEIVVALAKHFRDRGVPTLIAGDGMESTTIDAADRDAFLHFHRSTIGIFFHSAVSPAALLRSMVAENELPFSTVIFVTHLADPELFSLSENQSGQIATGVVLNLSGMSRRDHEQVSGAVYHARERGARIALVEGADSIREDLER